MAHFKSLINGAITIEDFWKDELGSLVFECKLLKEKYHNHLKANRGYDIFLCAWSTHDKESTHDRYPYSFKKN